MQADPAGPVEERVLVLAVAHVAAAAAAGQALGSQGKVITRMPLPVVTGLSQAGDACAD